MGFKERLTYGQEAEQAFEEYLKFAKINYTKSVNESNWSPNFDLINGDFGIYNERFDIKRNAISLHSLDNFQGKYFVVYHHDLSRPMVIEANEVRKLDRNNYQTLNSGDKGFKHTMLSTLKYQTFDEFFKTN